MMMLLKEMTHIENSTKNKKIEAEELNVVIFSNQESLPPVLE